MKRERERARAKQIRKKSINKNSWTESLMHALIMESERQRERQRHRERERYPKRTRKTQEGGQKIMQIKKRKSKN